MNNPPPVPPVEKKGMSGLAIAGFGCGGLILIILVVGFIFVGKACNKISEVAGDFTKNPAKATAMLVLKMNPDIEIISTDDAKNEVTFKEKQSGEVITMSFDDLAQGKLTMKDSKGEVISIDGSKAGSDGKITIKGKNGEESVIDTSGAKEGQMKIKSKDGEMTIGGGSMSDLPAWVPVYPGATSSGGGMKSVKENVATGAVGLQSADPVGKIKEFYEAKLKEAGYKVESNEITADGKQTVILNATNETSSSTFNVIASSEEGKTALMLNYSGPK